MKYRHPVRIAWLLLILGIPLFLSAQRPGGLRVSRRAHLPRPLHTAKLEWFGAPAAATAKGLVVDSLASTVTVVFVRNSGDTTALVRLSGLFRDNDGRLLDVRLTLGGDSLVPAGASRGVPVRMRWRPAGWPVTGLLILTDGRVTLPAANSLMLTINLVPSEWSGRIALYSLVVTVLTTLICAVMLREHLPSRFGSAPATWDYTTSWASNVNAAGALISLFIVAAATLEQPLYMSKAAYSLTSILFGALVVLAPTIYNLLRPAPGESMKGITFLLSCFLTLWGVFGQLLTLAVLVGEFASSRMLHSFAADAFWVVLALTGIAVVLYAAFTVRAAAAAAAEHPPAPLGVIQLPTARPARAAAGAPRWAIL